MITIVDVVEALKVVGHPAINMSLVELGIVTDIEIIDNEIVLVFAFPFPNIPIADQLINSVKTAVEPLGLNLKHSTRIMDEEEKAVFMQLETENWKG